MLEWIGPIFLGVCAMVVLSRFICPFSFIIDKSGSDTVPILILLLGLALISLVFHFYMPDKILMGRFCWFATGSGVLYFVILSVRAKNREKREKQKKS